MEITLKTYLEHHLNPISIDTIEHFKSIATYKKFSKGDIIIRSSQPTSKFYIIKSGLVAKSTTNEKGRQFIRNLYTKNKAFGALSSHINKNKKSEAIFICLTNCELFEADCYDFIKLKEEFEEFNNIYKRIIEETFLRSEEKIDEICLLTSAERFLKLKKEIPNICNILPQYQIAYYLNITPVQLSRIRKKIYSNTSN